MKGAATEMAEGFVAYAERSGYRASERLGRGHVASLERRPLHAQTAGGLWRRAVEAFIADEPKPARHADEREEQ